MESLNAQSGGAAGAEPSIGDKIEQIISQRIEEEKAKLAKELGVAPVQVRHFRRPVERPFTREERERTTILFGGLTWKHEHLIQGAMEGLGYKAKYIPTPDKRAFQLGKEYGNNGQCNPTYFTVGNLVQYLQRLEEQGMSR